MNDDVLNRLKALEDKQKRQGKVIDNILEGLAYIYLRQSRHLVALILFFSVVIMCVS